MGRPAGLEARAGRRDQRSFPMNASYFGCNLKGSSESALKFSNECGRIDSDVKAARRFAEQQRRAPKGAAGDSA
jgi:hypothetical protein